MLLETWLFDAIGGFGALRGELIDDCALARRVKALGGRTWIGLTHSALSGRRSARLADIWNMVALAAMMLSYLPTLRYYGRSPAWALAMPLIGTLYLAMTWTSALRYWRGERARWKDRSYTRAKGMSV